MKTVLDYIRDKQSDFRQHAFFSMLTDETVDIHHRMSFVTAWAPFVMNLADFFRYRVRDEASPDPIQQIVNKHTYIDDSHWKMYLQDLETILGDCPKQLIETIRLLWADHRSKARMSSYDIIAHVAQRDPVMRLVVLQSIEATGAIGFPIFTQASREYQRTTGRQLIYLGLFHEKLESGHIMGTDDIEATLAEIVLTPEMELRAKELVDVVFSALSSMLHESLAYVHSNLAAKEGLLPAATNTLSTSPTIDVIPWEQRRFTVR